MSVPYHTLARTGVMARVVTTSAFSYYTLQELLLALKLDSTLFEFCYQGKIWHQS
jgi:hypothetical protein